MILITSRKIENQLLEIIDSHIEVKGYSLFVRQVVPAVLVQSTVLVFLHDALGSVGQWRDFPEMVAQQLNCRVIVYDRPLHGLSGGVHYGSIKEQFDSEKEILHELLFELGVKMPGLIGVSDGATISLNYAASYPCDSVVAMAPHVIMEERIMVGIEGWMIKRTVYEEKLRSFHGDHTAPLIDQWYRLWKKADKEGWDMTPRLEDVKCPVFLIQDPGDPYGSSDQIDAIREKIPGAEIELIEKAGHFPYVNFPEKVIASIKSVL